MKLTLTTRALGKKSSLKQIRHLKDIPGVLYTLNKGVSLSVTIGGVELETHLRSISKGGLATKVFEIELDGKKSKAIVKQIQYHPVTYAILHLDLQEVEDHKLVSVNVPVVCINQDQCPGMKLGGQLKFIKRAVRVTCQANQLPEAFHLDMQSVGLGEVRRVRDLSISADLRVITKQDNVLVSVAK
ncbi:MAG: 50S ribosomal protein L25 [Chlamydiae bacterium]|nr:50S ribosomal protein L25 [Chlamydiota bacterium]